VRRTTRRRDSWRSDEGSGSVLTLAIAAVVVVLGAALAVQIQATVAHARAQAVADLSALAAAGTAQRAAFGEPVAADPCTLAAAVAAHNGGRLLTCEERDAGRVRVEAVVPTPVGSARAEALAGPSG
jgi:secretion/DNA translocation related TadE-like protein